MNENIVLTEYYSLEVGNSYSYEDYNTLLQQYNYYYSGQNEVRQSMYGIIVDAYIYGQDTLTLIREFEKGYESKLFIENGYQTILKGGTLPPRHRILNFNVRNTTLKLIRTNVDEPIDPTYKNKSIKLSGAIYNIYDSNYNYIKSVTTDEKGEAVVYDLPLGTFGIKEETPSYGFEPCEYFIDSTLLFGDTPKTEILYVIPIKKELNITNIYKVDNVEYYDSDINFELYKDNLLINTFGTDSNGKITTNLEYGKYTIKQLNSREGFDVEPEFELEVNELENNLNYIFIKEKNTEVENHNEDNSTEDNSTEDISNINEEQQNNEDNNEDNSNINEEEQNNEDNNEDNSDINEEEQNNEDNNEDTNLIEEVSNIEETETPITEEITETNTTNLVFETNNEITIDKLPRLSDTKDIFDILCENLLYYFCL
jgi:hypothetical protein